MGRAPSTIRCACSASCRAERLEALADRPRLPALPRRGARRARSGYLDGPRWFQARERRPAAVGRLLLARVRHRRGPAAVLGRPRRAGRRPPQGGAATSACRSSASGSSTATATSARACRTTAGSRSATPTSTRTRWRSRRARACASSVDLAGRPLHAQVWRADVGRIPLYLLDTDVDENEPDEPRRSPTASTAATSSTGCARRSSSASAACGRSTRSGIDAQVFHTNEGHAGFLGLERIRRLIVDDGPRRSPRRSRRCGPARSSRPTRPCPPASTASRGSSWSSYFSGVGRRVRRHASTSSWRSAARRRRAQRRALQHGGDGAAARRPIERRVEAARRGEPGDVRRPVARRPVDETPITSVTNGVHAPHVGRARDGRPAQPLRAARVGRGRPSAGSASTTSRDDELWRAREQGRERLVAFVRRRLRRPASPAGSRRPTSTWCDEVLDPKVLTVGFARRFATYKRATLLLSQPERLQRCCCRPTGRCSSCSPARPTPPTTPARR